MIGLLLLTPALAGCLAATDDALDPTTTADPDPAIPLPAGVDAELADLLTTPGVHDFNVTVAGEPAYGIIGVPASGTSDRLLVYAQGFTNEVAWARDMLQWYGDQGVLAVAMDYRGPVDAWKVRTGVADTIAATLAVQELHPVVDLTVLYGVSMGGEVSGLAVAEAPPGTFDYWIDGVGVMDLETLWFEWAGFGTGPIEDEAGGTPLEEPAAYRELSPLHRVDEIAAHGLERAYLVYGAADEIVPLEHGERMFDALAEAQVPVTYYVLPTNRNAWHCLPVVWVCPTTPVGPAGHEAGWTQAITDIVLARLDRAPDDPEPAVRYLYEGITDTPARLPGDVADGEPIPDGSGGAGP